MWRRTSMALRPLLGGPAPPPHLQNASPLVTLLRCNNPSAFTLDGTNTYIVGDGDRRVLIDTGDDRHSYAAALAALVRERHCRIEHIVLTHGHADHIGGLSHVLAALPGHRPRVWKHAGAPGDAALRSLHVEALVDGQVIAIPGATLRVLHTPGHTPDSASLLLAEECSAFVGDCVLGRGSAVFSSLRPYLASLRALIAVEPQRLYCGHGPIVGQLPQQAGDSTNSSPSGSERAPVVDSSESGTERLRRYLAHRMRRTEELIGALRERERGVQVESSSQRGWTVAELVDAQYQAEGTPFWLMPAARAVAALHMHALVEEGIAEAVSPASGDSVLASPASTGIAAGARRTNVSVDDDGIESTSDRRHTSSSTASQQRFRLRSSQA